MTTRSYQVTGGYVGELAWAPDGGLLAISTYELDRHDHTVLAFDPEEQEVRRVIDGCVITWAPDGRYFAVHREPRVEPGVWIVPRGEGDPIPVSPSADAFPIARSAEHT